MLTKYITGINWVDFLTIAILIRMCYIGVRTGIGIEIFKLLGLAFASNITFQIYTTPVADFLNSKVPALPLASADIFSFLVVLSIVTLIFRIVRESFFLLVKIEAHNTLDRWGGLLAGSVRGVWIASLALFMMTISTAPYLETSVKSGLLGSRLLPVAPRIYKMTYDCVISRFFANTPMNPEVSKVLER